MRTNSKFRMYICIFWAIFHIFFGICFEVVEADFLVDSAINSTDEGNQTFIDNCLNEVLCIDAAIIKVSDSEICICGRVRMVRTGFLQWFLAALFSALLLYIAYGCRRFIELSEILLISAMRNIIFYIHKQDGKKDTPVFF